MCYFCTLGSFSSLLEMAAEKCWILFSKRITVFPKLFSNTNACWKQMNKQKQANKHTKKSTPQQKKWVNNLLSIWKLFSECHSLLTTLFKDVYSVKILSAISSFHKFFLTDFFFKHFLYYVKSIERVVGICLCFLCGFVIILYIIT